ncbi:MAG TPA: hypothetical protein DIW47_03630 [Bacteroidetes bacterium]|nr:hypothetical protein [Bacteroidota bacterium]
MVIFHTDEADPYLEVWYSASMKKLESGIEKAFRGAGDKALELINDSQSYAMAGIFLPTYTGSTYFMSMEIVESDKRGKLIRFRFENEEPAFNLLNQRMGIFRNLMEEIQDIIDGVLQVKYYSDDQRANTMYLFSAKVIENNLSSYLFMYSKEHQDSTMKKLSEWLVLACEKPRVGAWLNDSTFRIDNLRQPAFGLNEPFSLTIVHSMVQGDYHQYEIYLSNYIAPGNENNYQVRPYDVQKRLWRYYNTLLFIEKASRR